MSARASLLRHGNQLRVKVCCISTPAEADMALDEGADVLGLVSAMPSGPGVIGDEEIRAIIARVGTRAPAVLLTCRQSAVEIGEQARMFHPAVLQLVDEVSFGELAALRAAHPAIVVMPVIHVRDRGAIRDARRAGETADLILLDSGNPGAAVRELGGTGRTHDWLISREIRESVDVPVFLAGGLRADNVAEAIESVRPFGVDVCSGVRERGRLDRTRLRAFMAAARAAAASVATMLAATLASSTAAIGQQPSVAGPITPIVAASGAADSNREITIAGRAVVGSGKLQSSAFDVSIQDTTGGMRLFARTRQTTVVEGDSVIATGVVKTYRGNLELFVSKVSVVEGPRRVLAPRAFPADPARIAGHGGELVRVEARAAAFGRSEGGQWLRLSRAGPPGAGTALTVWVPANHGAPPDLSRIGIEDSIAVTGIVTSYRDNGDDPVVWQVVPRDANDVEIMEGGAGLPVWILWLALAAAVVAGTWLAIGRLGAHRQLRALQETEARYRQLLALLPDAVIVHADGSILFTNTAAARLLGFPSGESLVGRPLSDFLGVEPASSETAVHGEGPGTTDTSASRPRARMQGADGEVIDVEIATSPCVYHDRAATVVLARDITAQLRYERDLHALALVDELTGIQNRRAFTLFAEQELARARRQGRTPVLVFADLDGLKQINDEHGHAAGDLAIRLVASALKSIFRETDVVARWSGDEFVALMVDGSEEASQLIAARLDAAITAQAPPDLPYVVTASVGASRLDPALPLRDAMERADAELYAEKKRVRRSKIRLTPPLGIDVVHEVP